ncbi:MAG: sulfurtransferase TusA family protein [Thermodesulfobacteriota bacterium]
MKADRSLDCKGLACPMPIVKLGKAIKELSSGQILEVVADDPGFEADVRAWCETTGHTLRGLEADGGVLRAYVEKA